MSVEQLLLAFLLQPVQHLGAVPLHLVLVDTPLQHSTGVTLTCFTVVINFLINVNSSMSMCSETTKHFWV